MILTPISSSNISAAGYNASTRELTIQFHNGGVYTYSGVPQNIYDSFLSASSKGSFHHQFIKNFPYRKVS